MKYFYAGALIWIKTIFFNATFFGIGALFMNNMDSFYGSFLVFIVSFVLTLPLLLIIIPLVKLFTKIPYRVQARIAGLTFNLMLLIIAFYLALLVGDGSYTPPDNYWICLLGTTIAGLLLSICTTRSRLTKLCAESDSQNTNQ